MRAGLSAGAFRLGCGLAVSPVDERPQELATVLVHPGWIGDVVQIPGHVTDQVAATRYGERPFVSRRLQGPGPLARHDLPLADFYLLVDAEDPFHL
jgi:hypothetical protein